MNIRSSAENKKCLIKKHMPTKRPAAAISQEIATAKARLAELEVELFEATRVGELVVTKDGQLLVTLPVSEKGVAPKHEQPCSYRYSGGEVCISHWR